MRTAHREARGPLLAVWCLWNELVRVVQTVHDDAVARQKLAWWQEELDRLPDDARHPVSALWTQHGLVTPDRLQIARTLPERLADVAIARPFLDQADLERHCRQTGIPLARLLILAADPDADTLDAYAAALGPALRRSELLLGLRESARLGRCHLPTEPLSAAGLHPDELAGLGNAAPVRSLLRALAGSIDRELSVAEQQIPASHWQKQTPNRVIAALHSALWQELAEDDHPLLTHHTELTPLRRLWIARRCARRRAP